MDSPPLPPPPPPLPPMDSPVEEGELPNRNPNTIPSPPPPSPPPPPILPPPLNIEENLPIEDNASLKNLRSEMEPFKPPKSKDEGIKPLKERLVCFRLDTIPYLVVYTSLIWLEVTENTFNQGMIVSCVFPLALISHVFLFFLQYWSISVERLVGYKIARKESNPGNWTHALVFNEAIVPLRLGDDHSLKCIYQDIVYRYNSDEKCFERLHFPLDWTESEYHKWKGHTQKSLLGYRNIYGVNILQVSPPGFLTLLQDQLVAPFFLFQVFCVLLWSLDEYWYYAIFTLFTLLIFESTMAYHRGKSLQRLRDTLKRPFSIPVYRFGVWEDISSSELIAGDIICFTDIAVESKEHYVPCDILILTDGTVVADEAMLTGESVPQLKESLQISEKDVHLDLADERFKKSILFGGTSILNISGSSLNDKFNFRSSSQDYCIGFVLRTGFETQQGNLLRTMIHSSNELDGVNTRDTFYFILMLLICAFVAAGFVLNNGWGDPTRNKFKLVLHVVIIITSVVPPELPMELSMAVTSSLADLIRHDIYCTEPWRIPLAGKVDTCCFDKTGTLTSDELRVRGLRLPPTSSHGLATEFKEILCSDGSKYGSNQDLVSPTNESVPNDTLRVLIGCQTLGLAKDRTTIVGDPLDKSILLCCKWTLHPKKHARIIPLSNEETLPPLTILHRWPFESAFKRMTVLALHQDKKFVLTKGAPEILKPLLLADSVPSNYDNVYRYHMSLGQRVIALAQKEISSDDSKQRSFYENQLLFAGFLILDCPLKPDTFRVINELKASSHRVVMITGDAALTAAEVARQVGIIDTSHKDTYELREMKLKKKDSVFAFVPITAVAGEYSPKQTFAFVPQNLSTLLKMVSQSEISLCVSGDVLHKLALETVTRTNTYPEKQHAASGRDKSVLLHPEAQKILQTLVPLVSVFARHAPTQKEAIIHAFNQAGKITLMCGDGCNDVGALKHAHVGISIISTPELEAKERKTKEAIMAERKKQKKTKKTGRSSFERSLLQELAKNKDELNYVALGDASVASPFTSRTMNIMCCKHVIQQGRCTLVTMIQIYKILGVNCLVNAVVLSKLHMHGVKQGDRQLTAVGLVVAALFFFVTKAKPLTSLSPKRPVASILCLQSLASITIQFIIHYIAIIIVTDMSLSYIDPMITDMTPDGPFHPNNLNTSTFLMTFLSTLITFIVNYRGRPFMQSLRENKLFLRSVFFSVFLLFLSALELFEPLNDLVQLAPLPLLEDNFEFNTHQMNSTLSLIVPYLGFKGILVTTMILDFLITFQIEKAIVNFFEG